MFSTNNHETQFHENYTVLINMDIDRCDEPSYTYNFPEIKAVDKVQLIKTGVKRIELDSTLGIVNQSLIYYENPSPRISILNTAARKFIFLTMKPVNNSTQFL